MIRELTARQVTENPEVVIRNIFGDQVTGTDIVDGIFIDTGFTRVLGVSGLMMKAPATLEILKNPDVSGFLQKQAGEHGSVLVCRHRKELKLYMHNGVITEEGMPEEIKIAIQMILSGLDGCAGKLNEVGEHEIDLFMPSPGPHFNVNLLLGNRVGYSRALQTTPKSVVDKMGGGSFRSHASTQVLASRWDMRQEENGFPANRQFYLFENNKKVFYSGEIKRDNLVMAKCTHSQNYTAISYKTKCGLDIERLIFISAQEAGLPIATEVQRIAIYNTGTTPRKLRLVYTGMFGSAAPDALFEDVLYSNIIMQSRILRDDDGSIMALSPDYYTEKGRKDLRFHTMLVHNRSRRKLAREFCVNYNEFVGNGTLQDPEGALKLSNNLYRKGPGFFAVAAEIELEPGERCFTDQITGLVSDRVNPMFGKDTLKQELYRLLEKFSQPDYVNQELEGIKKFMDSYSGFLKVNSRDKTFNAYVNKNLPFQVLYQTFVSRSFCQTQKGYREIGFREIQDIFTSMYYFMGMGMADFAKQLIKEWCAMIFEFGFAYHNFFWEGKEPGKWSDDQLWFIQAVYRYIVLTGDVGLLEEKCAIAGIVPVRERSVYETIKAVILYSAKISVGKNGLPLLDYADWNDCLKLDDDYINGIAKEELYMQQLEKDGRFGQSLKSNYSESVMNAFLLKVAVDEMIKLADKKGDITYRDELQMISCNLDRDIQKHAWKGDFFARVLFNRYGEGEYLYLGAGGDGLSADPSIDGSYFLNSFSWSILSDCARESQIEVMLEVVESRLKSPFGIKLVTPVELGRIAKNTATAEYFPGDRENGGVFKHASMMAATAMFKAAKEVNGSQLAERLSKLAYWTVDTCLPYKTMENPFVNCGNPRFCTQYNNSETGENTGPMLSGTSTWMTLAMMSALGIEYSEKGLIINPILRSEETGFSYNINMDRTVYYVEIRKPEGFFRLCEGNACITFDGRTMDSNILPVMNDKKQHMVVIDFRV